MRSLLGGFGRLALLVVTCFSYCSGDQYLSIDQMGGGKVIAAAENGANLLFCLVQFPKAELYSYNFSRNSFVQIQDGRLPNSVTAILPCKNGFLLFRNSFMEASPVLYLVDHQGSFLETLRLDDFEGYAGSMSINSLVTHKGGVIATLKNGIDSTELILAEVDISARKIQPIGAYALKKEMVSPFWVSDGDQLYFVDPYSRYLAKVDSISFHPSEVLLAELDKLPLKSERQPGVNSFSFLNFKPRLVDLSLAGGGLRLAEQIFTDKTQEVITLGRRRVVPIIDKKNYVLKASKLSSLDGWVLGAFQGHQLVFLEKEGVFQLR